MPTMLLKYMNGSLLFKQKYIADNYRLFSDAQLQEELNRYRDYCLHEIMDEAAKEVSQGSVRRRTLIESFGILPNLSLLKQSALYLDRVVINDPIFKLDRASFFL